MPLSKRILIFLIAVAAVVWGIKWYNADRIFYHKHQFDKYQWNSTDTIICDLGIKNGDFELGIDIELELRYIYGCSYSQIPIKLEVTKPGNTIVFNDIIIQIKDENGDYLGEGMGDYWDVKKTFYAEDLFDAVGNYKLRLWSDMGTLFLVDDMIVSIYKK